MVIHVYQLVRQGILHVLLVFKMALTEDDRPSRVEASGTRQVAWSTYNI